MENLLTEFKEDSKKESRLSLDEFKKSFVDKSSEEELEKLTGGILGDCHDEPTFMDKLKQLIDGIDDLVR